MSKARTSGRPAAAPQNPAERAPAARPRLGLAGILLLALLLRLIYLGQVASLPFFDHPVGESQVHLTLASQIAAGSFVPHRPFFYASVLYPYFLAVVLEISRERGFSRDATCSCRAAMHVPVWHGWNAPSEERSRSARSR